MPAKKTILHVFPTFGVGGSQIRTIMLAKAFGDEYHHDILSMDGRFEATELLDGIDWSPRNLERPNRGMMANIRTFRRMIKEAPPHVLVTYNWGAIEWAMANSPQRVPHIHAEDGFGPEEAAGQIPRRVWFRRLALPGKRLVVPALNMEKLVRDQWKIPFVKLHVVPLGIDPARFDIPLDQDMITNWGTAEQGPLIGTIAALRPEKRLDRMLRAFAKLVEHQPARLVIAGGGRELASLQALTKDLGLTGRVYFPGYLEDPARIIGAFDIFALSSDTEQMPTSILEAMAVGLPVAATDVGDSRHMVADSNKQFVRGHDSSVLSESLSKLVADPSLRRRLGTDNQGRAKTEYSLAKMLDRWHALYEGKLLD